MHALYARLQTYAHRMYARLYARLNSLKDGFNGTTNFLYTLFDVVFDRTMFSWCYIVVFFFLILAQDLQDV